MRKRGVNPTANTLGRGKSLRSFLTPPAAPWGAPPGINYEATRKIMRTFFVLICSCAFVCAAHGAPHARTSEQPVTHMQQAAHNRPNVQRAATQTQHGTRNSPNL